MNRRNFLKVTAATGALVAISPSLGINLRAADGTLYTAYERVQLVDADGIPIKASSLKKETNYVFNYPHVGTPVILLDLDEPTAKDVNLKSEDGEEYVWKSGVGKNRTIVAYSAVCSHQMAHPTPEDTFIQYVQKDKQTAACSHGGVMVCSSHLSSFDVGKGCKNISGPAKQPLASIVLEIAEDDSIWAVAVLGPDMFHRYFNEFKPEMKQYYGGKRKAKKHVKDSALMVTLSEYSKEQIQY